MLSIINTHLLTGNVPADFKHAILLLMISKLLFCCLSPASAPGPGTCYFQIQVLHYTQWIIACLSVDWRAVKALQELLFSSLNLILTSRHFFCGWLFSITYSPHTVIQMTHKPTLLPRTTLLRYNPRYL